MKLIYFESTLEILKKVSIQLEGEFDVEVDSYSSLVPALRAIKLSEGSISSLLILRDMEDFKLFESFFCNEENTSFCQNVILGSEVKSELKILGYLSLEEILTGQLPFLLKEKGLDILKVSDASYKKINIYSFSQFNNAPVDIFIRLSEEKYVKVVNKSDMYSSEVIEKYKKRAVKYLYVKAGDFTEYLEDLSSNLSYLLDEDLINQSTKFSLEKVSLDIVHKSIRSIGISEKTIELTNKVMNSVVSSVKRDKKLWAVLKKSVLEVDHAAEHAIAVSYLCSSILENLKWDSAGTISKMTISSFFHDLSLRESLSFIRDLEGDLFKSLNENEKEEFLSHPEKTILKIRKIKRLPPNVEDIILEHHERPGGNGFPRKKTSFTITPLTCVFIIAEEFWYRINRTELNKNSAQDVLAEMRKIYCEGNFKKPFIALDSVVGGRG